MDWFKHDIHALSDDRLSALVMEFGAEGYAVYFHSIEAMYMNQGNPISGVAIKRIAKDLSMGLQRVLEILEYAASGECESLLTSSPEGFSSDRVVREIRKQKDLSEIRSEAGKRGLASRWGGKGSESDSNCMASDSKCIANDSKQIADKIRREEIRVDKNNITNSELRSSLVSPKPSHEDLRADPPFTTIITNSKEEFPVYEKDISMWKEAYPGVDVKAELLKMRSWSDSNPKNRKTMNGMKRFINGWLSREQNRSGRMTQTEVIKGTNIHMSVTADGSDPSKYTGTLEDMMRKYGGGK